MTYILGERIKELTEDVDQGKALKEVSNAMTKKKARPLRLLRKRLSLWRRPDFWQRVNWLKRRTSWGVLS